MGPGPHEVHFQKEEMMKTRILLIAVALLASALFTSSCSKADFLEGTVWHCDDETWESDLFFVNKSECRLLYEGGIIWGDYSGDKSNISIRLYNTGEIKGTIKGDAIKCTAVVSGNDGVSLTFKKKK